MERKKLYLIIILVFFGGYILINMMKKPLYYNDLFVQQISINDSSKKAFSTKIPLQTASLTMIPSGNTSSSKVISKSINSTTTSVKSVLSTGNVPKNIIFNINETLDDLLKFSKKNKFPNGIPKILHYNYKSKMVPSQYVPLVKHCMEINPNIKFVFWTDVSSFLLIENYFPADLDTYRSYLQTNSDPLKKSDLIRYFILYYFGGIYMDLDTRCQRNMEEVMKEGSCMLSREAEVHTRIRWNYDFYTMNSFMACVYRHKFFNYVINKIKRDDNSEILGLTGPRFLTNVFIEYNTSLTKDDFKNPYKYVTVPSSDLFSPFVENYIFGYCINPKGKWNIIGCKDLEAYMKTMEKKISNAVVVHLFFHLGGFPWKNNIKKLEDISNLRSLKMVV